MWKMWQVVSCVSVATVCVSVCSLAWNVCYLREGLGWGWKMTDNPGYIHFILSFFPSFFLTCLLSFFLLSFPFPPLPFLLSSLPPSLSSFLSSIAFFLVSLKLSTWLSCNLLLNWIFQVMYKLKRNTKERRHMDMWNLRYIGQSFWCH